MWLTSIDSGSLSSAHTAECFTVSVSVVRSILNHQRVLWPLSPPRLCGTSCSDSGHSESSFSLTVFLLEAVITRISVSVCVCQRKEKERKRNSGFKSSESKDDAGVFTQRIWKSNETVMRFLISLIFNKSGPEKPFQWVIMSCGASNDPSCLPLCAKCFCMSWLLKTN